MKRRTFTLGGVAAASTIVLAACGGGRTAADAGDGDDAGGGFDADATIGVSLPWLGTQNWAEAEDLFKAQLEDAGFTALIQAADNKVPQQQQQIEAMVQKGAKAIVVGPIDGTQLGSALTAAKDAGVRIIGYDRLIENTDAVDATVQFGSVRTGELQGQSLLDGLAERKGEGPYNIELFGGGPADPNAPNFFQGAMSVLQPKIDDGTVVVLSGQTDFQQAATQDWDNGKAQSRMDSILAANYSDTPIDGVLSPNDGIARAVITSCKSAGQDVPVVDGLDAETESITSIWAGEQYSTVHKPTSDLVAKTVEIISAYQTGDEAPEADETENNGTIDVPVYALDPVVVTKDNAEEIFADDPDRLALLDG
ncbi:MULTISPECIES: substrate-binding domain-containing protein [Brachybacterium]|uniref:substrate-binding domain-containing protein n=1 Tax=Brachybacterium TaxID=43668 RepID=UPI000DF485D3|nr:MULTISPECIES: sugar-binding protein [Brachybacterium]RCS65580.1 sugar ABC transporter substrate-binding protein [Brachybacterium sp. JB7]RCS66753.1 sugar ABC transporter substrate-binding protein [Brachybacterium alimentarium]RCS74503.1 sugar ABC transporter substrate-binding protein [Brachybacterium alimentarium]RCS87069.1 sugar ABC transporter substrate-binding protein [Brachybacterium alimentarium]RCS91826.1 sugar ABC transporter substrate-binding protein [Brachybacterium alimentarium]